MLDPFVAALAAQFRAPGSAAAVYTGQDGLPVPIRVIVSQPDQEASLGTRRIVEGSARVSLQRSDVDQPEPGDTVLLTAAVPRSGRGWRAAARRAGRAGHAGRHRSLPRRPPSLRGGRSAVCHSLARSRPGGKRLVRLARWHWSGGDAGSRYCEHACEWRTNGRCRSDRGDGATCAYVEHAPQTEEGLGVWDVVAGCGSQLRYVTMALPMGGTITRAVGLDFGIVLAMGAALEADAQLLAQVLPGVEAAIVAGMNDDGGEVTDG